MPTRNVATVSKHTLDHLTDWDWVIAARQYVAEDAGVTDEDIKRVEAEVQAVVYGRPKPEGSH